MSKEKAKKIVELFCEILTIISIILMLIAYSQGDTNFLILSGVSAILFNQD